MEGLEDTSRVSGQVQRVPGVLPVDMGTSGSEERTHGVARARFSFIPPERLPSRLSAFCLQRASPHGDPAEIVSAQAEAKLWREDPENTLRGFRGVVSGQPLQFRQQFLQRYALLLYPVLPRNEFEAVQAFILQEVIEGYGEWIKEIQQLAETDCEASARQFYCVIESCCAWATVDPRLQASLQPAHVTKGTLWQELTRLCASHPLQPALVINRLPFASFTDPADRHLLSRLYVLGGLCKQTTNCWSAFITATVLSIEDPSPQQRHGVNALVQLAVTLEALPSWSAQPKAPPLNWPDPAHWHSLFSHFSLYSSPLWDNLLKDLGLNLEQNADQLALLAQSFSPIKGHRELQDEALRLLKCWNDLTQANVLGHLSSDLDRAEWYERLRKSIERWIGQADLSGNQQFYELESAVLTSYAGVALNCLELEQQAPASRLINALLRRREAQLFSPIVPLIIALSNPSNQSSVMLMEIFKHQPAPFLAEALIRPLLGHPDKILLFSELAKACWERDIGIQATARRLSQLKDYKKKGQILFEVGFLEFCRDHAPLGGMMDASTGEVSGERLVRIGRWILANPKLGRKYRVLWLSIVDKYKENTPGLVPLIASIKPSPSEATKPGPKLSASLVASIEPAVEIQYVPTPPSDRGEIHSVEVAADERPRSTPPLEPPSERNRVQQVTEYATLSSSEPPRDKEGNQLLAIHAQPSAVAVELIAEPKPETPEQVFGRLLKNQAFEELGNRVSQDGDFAKQWNEGLSSEQVVSRATVLANEVPAMVPHLMANLNYLDASSPCTGECVLALAKAVGSKEDLHWARKLSQFLTAAPKDRPRWKTLSSVQQSELLETLLSWSPKLCGSATNRPFIPLTNALLCNATHTEENALSRLEWLATHCGESKEWQLETILPNLFTHCSFVSIDSRLHAVSLLNRMPHNYARYSTLRKAQECGMPRLEEQLQELAELLLEQTETSLSLADRKKLATHLLAITPSIEIRDALALALYKLALELNNNTPLQASLFRRLESTQRGSTFEALLGMHCRELSSDVLASAVTTVAGQISSDNQSGFAQSVRRVLIKMILAKPDQISLDASNIRYLLKASELIQDFNRLIRFLTVIQSARRNNKLSDAELGELLETCSQNLERTTPSVKPEDFKSVLAANSWLQSLTSFRSDIEGSRSKEELWNILGNCFLNYMDSVLNVARRSQDDFFLSKLATDFQNNFQHLCLEDKLKFAVCFETFALSLAQSKNPWLRTNILHGLIRQEAKRPPWLIAPENRIKIYGKVLSQLRSDLSTPDHFEEPKQFLEVIAGLSDMTSDVMPALANEHFQALSKLPISGSSLPTDRLYLEIAQPLLCLRHRPTDVYWKSKQIELLEKYLYLMIAAEDPECFAYGLQLMAPGHLPVTTPKRYQLLQKLLLLIPPCDPRTTDHRQGLILGMALSLHVDSGITLPTISPVWQPYPSLELLFQDALKLYTEIHSVQPGMSQREHLTDPVALIVAFALETSLGKWSRSEDWVDVQTSQSFGNRYAKLRDHPMIKLLLPLQTSGMLRHSLRRCLLHLCRIYARTGKPEAPAEKYKEQALSSVFSRLKERDPPLSEAELMMDTIEDICQRLNPTRENDQKTIKNLLLLAVSSKIYANDPGRRNELLRNVMIRAVLLAKTNDKNLDIAIGLWTTAEQLRLFSDNAVALDSLQRMIDTAKRKLDGDLWNRLMPTWERFVKTHHPQRVDYLRQQLEIFIGEDQAHPPGGSRKKSRLPSSKHST